MAVVSNARASSSVRPSSLRRGRSGNNRLSPVSRTANSSNTDSAISRRPTNPMTWDDASSIHCASSIRHTSGFLVAASATSPSTARPTTNRSGAVPAVIPNATCNACSWGSGSVGSAPSIGLHSWCSAAKGSSISDSTPAIWATRKSVAFRAQYCSSAVLPMPASPRTTSAALSPPRTLSSARSTVSRSRARPTSAGRLGAVTHHSLAFGHALRQ